MRVRWGLADHIVVAVQLSLSPQYGADSTLAASITIHHSWLRNRRYLGYVQVGQKVLRGPVERQDSGRRMRRPVAYLMVSKDGEVAGNCSPIQHTGTM